MPPWLTRQRTRRRPRAVFCLALVGLHGLLATAAAPALAGEPRLQVPLVVIEGAQTALLQSLLAPIGEAAGLDWQIQAVPPARLRAVAARGQAIAFGLPATAGQADGVYALSAPVLKGYGWLVVRRGQGFPFARLSDLTGRTACVSEGTSFGPEFDKARQQIFKVQSYAGALKKGLNMLEAGRCDLLVLGSHRGPQPQLLERELREGSHADVEVVAHPFVVRTVHFGVQRGHPLAALLPRIDAAIQARHRELEALVAARRL